MKSNPPPTDSTGWHALESDRVLEQLDSRPEGLSAQEAEERLQRHGVNRLTPAKKKGPLARFALQFHNLLIYVLLAAAAVTLLLGHWVDTGVILGVVIVNAIIGFIQEGKAEKALDAIRQMLSQQAMVRRDGAFKAISAEELVPGDIVMLQSGDKVPADLRLFKARDLKIDEAILTGESLSADKQVAPVEEQALLGDRCSMAYSGTLVSSGQGQGVVTATGDHTEIGHISSMLGEVEQLTTPLLRQMAQFAKWLSAAIIIIASLTFLFGLLLRDYTAEDMFLAAVGLTVAAIPEGLPAIMTITLAIGVQRMAGRNAIIRRLPAVETLGAVTVVCSDKTGTLTRNEMTATSLITAERTIRVTGEGYDPHGAFYADDASIDPQSDPLLRELILAGGLCNDAALEEKGDQWIIHGDPTEGALLTLAVKASLQLDYEKEQWPRMDAIPFESEHKFMATLHHDHAGHSYVYLKGAPERVLQMCTHQRCDGDNAPLDPDYWHRCMEATADQGQRMLALAIMPLPSEQHELRFEDVEHGLTLIGLVGMMDPPREEAIAAIAACHGAGVRVKMITGDHAATARSIGRQMGIGDGRAVLGGHELDKLDDAELQQAIDRTDIFARTSPEHKLRIVTALQARNQVVSMTGDGVNDAPALKRADIGVAMGIKGTEVSKEAAEMVLADDNFRSIASAIEEGRTVYDNLKKSILFILPTNGGQALTIITAIMTGRLLPITPVQILWVNMITAVTLALALAFETTEKNVMQRPPRDPAEPLLSGFLIWRILFVSLILVTGTFGLFLWEREAGTDIETARTVAVNTLVAFEIFYLFCARYLYAPSYTWEGLTGNRYALMVISLLVVFQIAFTYAPPLQLLFGTRPLDGAQWARILLVGASVGVFVEAEKWVLRRSHSRRALATAG